VGIVDLVPHFVSCAEKGNGLVARNPIATDGDEQIKSMKKKENQIQHKQLKPKRGGQKLRRIETERRESVFHLL
jgi:hypothetical protein